MLLEVNTETFEALFSDMLIQDYKSCLENIAALKEMKKEFGKLEAYQMEDLVAYKRCRKAYKVLLENYVTSERLCELEGF